MGTKTLHFLSSSIVVPWNKATSWIGSQIFPARSRSFSNSHLGRRGSCIRDVYLGGSVGTPWREQIAIPMDNSRILLFVIQNNSRSVSAMSQAAYLIGSGCNVVLCVQDIAPDTVLDTGDVVSKAAN